MVRFLLSYMGHYISSRKKVNLPRFLVLLRCFRSFCPAEPKI